MKIIFLDIDGVLYPCRDRKPLRGDKKELKSKLVAKHGRFASASEDDLLVAYEGFQPQAMHYVKQLVDKSGARIVITSSWKYTHNIQDFSYMFALYHLSDALLDTTENDVAFMKEAGIRTYIKKHPTITSYVILDDLDMRKTFFHRAVVCPDVLDEEAYQQALHVLNDFN